MRTSAFEETPPPFRTGQTPWMRTSLLDSILHFYVHWKKDRSCIELHTMWSQVLCITFLCLFLLLSIFCYTS